MMIDLYIQIAPCVFAILALAYLRRLQGRNMSTHNLREFINKLVIRLSYVLIIATCFDWNHWWNGVAWGLFIGFFYLNAWHEFGDSGKDAVRRYGLAGIFYPLSYRYVSAGHWTNAGEIGLGAGVGVYTYLASTIL